MWSLNGLGRGNQSLIIQAETDTFCRAKRCLKGKFRDPQYSISRLLRASNSKGRMSIRSGRLIEIGFSSQTPVAVLGR